MTRPGTVTRDAIGEVDQRLEELRRSFDDDVRSAPVAEAEKAEEFLLFTLADEAYAYPIIHALEVSPVPPIVPVPGLPPSVLGIVNSRGQVLSVTTIHSQLGLTKGEAVAGGRIIVTKDLPLVTGILVDSVENIIDVVIEDIQPLPATMRDDKARLLAGQVDVDDRLVFLLDMEQICGLESLRVTQSRRSGDRPVERTREDRR